MSQDVARHSQKSKIGKKEKDLYYAVVEHVRTWLSEDGAIRTAIDKAGGLIDGTQVRQIAKIYNVNRGITKGNKKGDLAANRLAKLLNSYHNNWKVNLCDRAKQCKDIASKAKSRKCTSKTQVSAITKFSWFVSPANWTVYDRYVAKALKIKEGPAAKGEEGPAVRRMLKFYKEAEALNFLTHAKEIDKIIARSQILNLSGPRVLDKLLMLRGADKEWKRQTISNCENFLSILPKALRDDVKKIAREVQRKLDPSILIRR